MLNPKSNKRELVYIAEVVATKELPGYDRVHSVTVLGWNCVAPKDIKLGDKVLYFEIDSLLPATDERFDFMAKRNYRVRTQRMCGTISQGLILPLSDFPELVDCKLGDFVTDKLGVTIYNADDPTPIQSKQKQGEFDSVKKKHNRLFNNCIVKFCMRWDWFRSIMKYIFVPKKKAACWPEWLPKTGSERIQNMPFLFNKNHDEKYVITEKVDGCSTSFWLDKKNNYYVASHNVIKQTGNVPNNNSGFYANNVWVESSAKYNMEELLKSLKTVHGLKTVAIQGETYGDKIQKRNYSLKNNKHDFVVFHIWFDGKRLPIKEMIKICEDRNLPHVHVYDYEYKIPNSVEDVIEYVDKCKSAIDGGDIEGFVFYTQDGQQNFKCVSPNFLLKYH